MRTVALEIALKAAREVDEAREVIRECRNRQAEAEAKINLAMARLTTFLSVLDHESDGR